MLGAVLALSLMVDVLARRLGLPRVSLLVLTGVAIATAARVLLEQEVTVLTAAVAEPLVSIALVMVAFLLGGDLTAERWRLTGRPVLALAPKDSELASLIRELDCGVVVDNFNDPALVAAAIRELINDPARRETLAANARSAAEKSFNTHQAAERYSKLINEL